MTQIVFLLKIKYLKENMFFFFSILNLSQYFQLQNLLCTIFLIFFFFFIIFIKKFEKNCSDFYEQLESLILVLRKRESQCLHEQFYCNMLMLTIISLVC